jgi:hypothetical protein
VVTVVTSSLDHYISFRNLGQRPESDLNSSPNHNVFIGRLTDVSLVGNGNGEEMANENAYIVLYEGVLIRLSPTRKETSHSDQTRDLFNVSRCC